MWFWASFSGSNFKICWWVEGGKSKWGLQSCETVKLPFPETGNSERSKLGGWKEFCFTYVTFHNHVGDSIEKAGKVERSLEMLICHPSEYMLFNTISWVEIPREGSTGREECWSLVHPMTKGNKMKRSLRKKARKESPIKVGRKHRTSVLKPSEGSVLRKEWANGSSSDGLGLGQRVDLQS